MLGSSGHQRRVSGSTENGDSLCAEENLVSVDEQQKNPTLLSIPETWRNKSFLPTPDSTQVFENLGFDRTRSQAIQPSNDGEGNTATSVVANSAKPNRGHTDRAVGMPTSGIFLSRIFELREAFKAFGGPWSSNGELPNGSKIDLLSAEIFTWVTTEHDRRQLWIHNLNSMIPFAGKPSRATRPLWETSSRPFMGQISILRFEFSHDSEPGPEDIARLANELGISKPEVDYWFNGEREIRFSCLVEGELARSTQERSSLAVSNVANFQSTQSMGSMYSTNSDYLGFYPETAAFSTLVGFPEECSPQLENQNAASAISATSRIVKRPIASCYDDKQSLAPPQRRQKRPRHNSAPGPFKCLFNGCDKSRNTLDEWRSHQTSYHFLLCVYICPETDCQQILIRKKGNFEKHLKDRHGYQAGDRLQIKVKECAVNTTSIYHEICGFCKQALTSREDSLTHIRNDLSKGWEPEQWVHLCKSDHSLESHVRNFRQRGCRPQKLPKPDFGDNEDDEDDDSDDDGNSHDHGKAHKMNRSSTAKKANSSGGGSCSTNLHTSNLSIGSGEQSLTKNSILYAKHLSNRDVVYAPQLSFNYTSLPLRLKPRNLVFEHVRYLGRGTFGTIDEVFCKFFIKTFARKTIRLLSKPHKPSESFKQFKNELRMMKQVSRVNSSHFTRILTHFVHRDRFEIIMSPVADGNLASFLWNGSADFIYPEHNHVFLKWMLCLISAVACLHQQQIGHGDLKPANVLIRHGKVFVADFGSAKTISDPTITSSTGRSVFTPMYSAPEIINRRPHSLSTDIFSLGCIYAELATRFQNKSLEEFATYRGLGSMNVSYYMSVQRTDQWLNDLSSSGDTGIAESCAVTSNMLREEPSARPLADQVLSEMRRLIPFGCCAKRADGIPSFFAEEQDRQYRHFASQRGCLRNRKSAKTHERRTKVVCKNSNSSSVKPIQCQKIYFDLKNMDVPFLKPLGLAFDGFPLISYRVSGLRHGYYWVNQEAFIGIKSSSGFLLDAGADFKSQSTSKRGTEALTAGPWEGDSGLVPLPSDAGAYVDHELRFGETLQAPPGSSGAEVLQALLGAGVDFDWETLQLLLEAADDSFEISLSHMKKVVSQCDLFIKDGEKARQYCRQLAIALISCSQTSSQLLQAIAAIASRKNMLEGELSPSAFRLAAHFCREFIVGYLWTKLLYILQEFPKDFGFFFWIMAQVNSDDLFKHTASAAQEPRISIVTPTSIRGGIEKMNEDLGRDGRKHVEGGAISIYFVICTSGVFALAT